MGLGLVVRAIKFEMFYIHTYIEMCIINYSSAYDRGNSAEKSIVHQIVFCWWDFFLWTQCIFPAVTYTQTVFEQHERQNES